MQNSKIISALIIVIASLLAVTGIGWWLGQNPTTDFVASVPGMDNAPVITKNVQKKGIVTHFKKFDVEPIAMPGSWPRFRGANYDNISTETVPLADHWGPKGPQIIWSVDVGEGYAAPVVWKGRVYILDYDETNKADTLRCFSLADGREIWRRWYEVHVKRNHGMSRTVPAVTDNYLVTIGPKCHVMCVSPSTGDFLWAIDLVQDYGAKVPLWYTGQCALIDGELAIIAPGGPEALILAVNCADGQIVWRAPNPKKWKMSHSSIMPVVFKNKKMYIYCAVGGMVGISADGADRGQILWQTSEWKPAVIAPTPIFMEDGRMFVTAGYGAGSMMLQLTEQNGEYSVKVLQKLSPEEGLASEQQTPLLYQGCLLGILPKDAGALKKQFVCCRPDDCSKFLWTSGKSNRFGLGPYLMADGKIFVLDDSGVLTLLGADVTEYKQLAQAKIMDGHDSWGPLALAGGRLLLRDMTRLVCLDVRAK